MRPYDPCRIVSAEKLKEGLLIEFEDGRCAIFSDSLLFVTLPQAIEVKNTEPGAKVTPASRFFRPDPRHGLRAQALASSTRPVK